MTPIATTMKAGLTGATMLVLAAGLGIGTAGAQQLNQPGAGAQGGGQTEIQRQAPATPPGAGQEAPRPPSAQGSPMPQAEGEARIEGRSSPQGEGSARVQGEATPQGEGSARIEGQAEGTTGGQEGQTQGERSGSDTSATGQAGAQGRAGAQGQTEARGGASGDVKLEQKQVTEIRQYFQTNKVTVEPVQKASISVSVGVVVPERVRLYPLPPAITVVVVADCPLHYFVWGDDIVIVDSCSREVVEILVGVA